MTPPTLSGPLLAAGWTEAYRVGRGCRDIEVPFRTLRLFPQTKQHQKGPNDKKILSVRARAAIQIGWAARPPDERGEPRVSGGLEGDHTN